MKRAILVVIDALGVGAMPDAPSFGDSMTCDTLGNVARHCGGLSLPCLGQMGLGNVTNVEGVPANQAAIAMHGRMLEVSRGKDTTTGHWELAGLILDKPFEVYPDGFPPEIMNRFLADTGCGGYLGNVPASGTAIIEEFDEAHRETGHPIIYTSADSVFQIACNVDVVGLDELYGWCQIARRVLDDTSNVSRVIARPYHETGGKLVRLGSKRRDYSVPPPRGSVLDRLRESGARVIGVGKIADIFLGQGITHSVHTSGNTEGLKRLSEIVNREMDIEQIAVDRGNPPETDRELIFVNLVDTDMLYGHRNDPRGFGNALEEIDHTLSRLLPALGDDDLLLVVADHGCDPTQPGTDHTREMVPLLAYNRGCAGGPTDDKASFTYVARTVSNWLDVAPDPGWAH